MNERDLQVLEALLAVRKAVRDVQMAVASLTVVTEGMEGEAGKHARLAVMSLTALAYADRVPEEDQRDGRAWQEPILAAATAIFGGRFE